MANLAEFPVIQKRRRSGGVVNPRRQPILSHKHKNSDGLPPDSGGGDRAMPFSRLQSRINPHRTRT